MHNKSFTADNKVTIIGGRNVGDEYFGAHHDWLFVDLDILAVGAVVEEVSRDFDRYWNSASSCPVDQVLPAASTDSIRGVTAAAWRVEHQPATLAYLEALSTSRCVPDLLDGSLPLEWAMTTMVSDDPAKGLGRAARRDLLWARLERNLQEPTRELQLISPYFVPTAAGVAFFRRLEAQGVRVSVLTNSLEATDVPAVHSGYAKRRKALLEAGVAFEIKGAPVVRRRRRRRRGRGLVRGAMGS